MSFFLLLLLLRHAFRQILILDKTFMLLVSENIFPMSPHVPTCPQISPNVPKCPQMSPNVRKMSRKWQQNVNKNSTKGQQKSQQKVNKFLSWIRKPKSVILDKKTGKSTKSQQKVNKKSTKSQQKANKSCPISA